MASRHWPAQGLTVTSFDTPAHVLLVEDNPLDARVALRTLAAWETPHTVTHIDDGERAIEYLNDASSPSPNLVLLDLNLPSRSGHEVLTDMRSHDTLRRIPVVVLTTSAAESDIRTSYDLGANAYIQKPSDLDGWRSTLGDVESFWLGRALLPGFD